MRIFDRFMIPKEDKEVTARYLHVVLCFCIVTFDKSLRFAFPSADASFMSDVNVTSVFNLALTQRCAMSLSTTFPVFVKHHRRKLSNCTGASQSAASP